MGPRYAAGAAAERIVVALDALTLVYHRPSGETHLLATPAPELLDMLDDGPADAAGLLGRLAASYELGDADADVISARLDELAGTGLIRRL